MAYVALNTIHVPAIGGVAPATWGGQVHSNFVAVRSSVGIARRAAVQSINDSAYTIIAFDTEDTDQETYVDIAGGATKITLPRTGNYLIELAVAFAANATGIRHIGFWRNAEVAADYVAVLSNVGAAFETVVRATVITGDRTAADYYQFKAWQNSTGALNITARVAVSLLRDNT